uniref:hypothetical protein n=1 Tax=Caballeronia sp. NCTM5 TaxID=2921755 RepID=UPI0020280527
MRKLFLAVLLVAVASILPIFSQSSFAAAASAQHASQPAVALTPQQARDALAVLNDPARRSQVADTLRAIAAAGALAAPVCLYTSPSPRDLEYNLGLALFLLILGGGG